MTELALAAARLDGTAEFELVVRRYERQVLVTALRLLGNLADAQDASQDVFLRLYRNLDKIDDPAECGAWLYRVTVNVCHDLRRRRPEAEPEADPADPAPDAFEQMAAEERQRALAALLRRLPGKERAAVVLRDLEGLSTREVALILGSSEATVRSQASQGRLRLRAWLGSYFGRRE